MLITGKIPQIAATLDITADLLLMIALNFLYFNNGKVKKILSHKFWSPIFKMGLSIYLISGYILNETRMYQMETLEVTNFTYFVSIIKNRKKLIFKVFIFQILMLFGDILRSFVPVVLTFVLIEEPFARLGEIIAEKL